MKSDFSAEEAFNKLEYVHIPEDVLKRMGRYIRTQRKMAKKTHTVPRK